MSLRQDVLKANMEDIEGRLRAARLKPNGRSRTFQDHNEDNKEKEKDDSDSDDLINVVRL